MTRKPKLMPVPEAIEEGRRWLAYLEREAARAKHLAGIAAARRIGGISLDEAHDRMGRWEREHPTVYDGARLAEAVKSLIENAERDPA